MSPLPEALLTYAVTPATVPESETVTLELAVANATDAYVPCEQIVFSLPVGTKGGALTGDPGSISAAPVAGTSWSISGDGAGNFTATPNVPVTGLGKNASIAFLLQGVKVNATGGLAAIHVVEETGKPVQARSPGSPPAVAKTKPGLAITSFTASPIAVCPGAQATIAWTTTGAERCTLSWPGGSRGLGPSDSLPVNPDVATTYRLTATGGGRSVHEDLNVAVLGPQIVSFAAVPADVVLGSPSTLSWLVVNADSCVIKPHVGHVDPSSGSASVTPDAPTAYFLEATGCGATVSANAYVDLTGPAITQLVLWTTMSGDLVQAGLGWEIRGANAVTLGGAPVAASGQGDLSPAGGPVDLVATIADRTTSVQVEAAGEWSDFSELEAAITLSCAGGLNVPGQKVSVDWDSGNDDIFEVGVTLGSGGRIEAGPGSGDGSLQFVVDGPADAPYLWTGTVTATAAQGDDRAVFTWTFPPVLASRRTPPGAPA